MIVLVTGASGGFGAVLVRALRAAGHTVYGTARSPEPGRDYGCQMLAMEISDEDSIAETVREVVSREGALDVVINCVNTMVIGAVEECPVDEVESLFQTNVFGAMRVCQAVLPQMRKQGGGTIVNMSSLGGLLAVPLMSAYTAAKFALEAFSEALYHEAKPVGVSVVIMQPVAMAMARGATGSHLELASGVTAGSVSHRMVARMAKDTAASRLTPEMVAAKIVAVLERQKKPLRVPMDRARAIGFLKRFAPQRVLHKLVSSLVDNGPARAVDDDKFAA